jgi:hypothetical protein
MAPKRKLPPSTRISSSKKTRSSNPNPEYLALTPSNKAVKVEYLTSKPHATLQASEVPTVSLSSSEGEVSGISRQSSPVDLTKALDIANSSSDPSLTASAQTDKSLVLLVEKACQTDLGMFVHSDLLEKLHQVTHLDRIAEIQGFLADGSTGGVSGNSGIDPAVSMDPAVSVSVDMVNQGDDQDQSDNAKDQVDMTVNHVDSAANQIQIERDEEDTPRDTVLQDENPTYTVLKSVAEISQEEIVEEEVDLVQQMKTVDIIDTGFKENEGDT